MSALQSRASSRSNNNLSVGNKLLIDDGSLSDLKIPNSHGRSVSIVGLNPNPQRAYTKPTARSPPPEIYLQKDQEDDGNNFSTEVVLI